MLRTRTAGSLRASDIGQVVTLTGWVDRRRDHGGVAFIDLRDASGIAQVVIREEIAHDLRAEYVLAVTGEVSARPEGNANPNLPTGEIEVVVSDVEILNASAPLPFQVSDHAEDAGQVGEEARLRYRYLDLRRSAMQHTIRLRAKVSQAARRVLDSHDFVEIETPTLTRSTPEGARDFLVPARLAPGSWYALPQSPQLFKQLLMVAGMERYYQIARCYRDEDFRADRQPEFTQLDVEMSFVEQDDVIAVAEDVLREVWALIDYELPTPIARMTYHDAMERYARTSPTCASAASWWTSPTTSRTPPSGSSRTPTWARSSCPVGPPSPDAPSTPGRSGPSSAVPRAWPTSPSPTTGPSVAPSPRTSPTPSGPAWPRPPVPSPATASSSPPGLWTPPAPCWARPPGDRQALRPHQRRRVVLRPGSWTPPVQALRRGQGRR